MFQLHASSSLARTGLVLGSVPTPAFLVHTVRGTPPHLTPDNAGKVVPPTAMYQGSLADLLIPAVDAYEQAGGGRAFFNLNAHPLFMFQRDALMNEAVQGGDKIARVSTYRGVRELTSQSFMKLHNALQPSVCVVLSDEVTHEATASRCRKSTERSQRWLAECVKLHSDSQARGHVAAL
jgi:queuine/archaeosine tRNA-ribosyltransferase